MVYNLNGQIKAFANATHVGLKELNAQLQATSKMTLQNRLMLDLLLLHENGGSGYLNLDNDTCCIHIPNVTQDLNEQLYHIKLVAKASRELRGSMEVG